MKRQQPDLWTFELAKVENQIAKFIHFMKEDLFTPSMKPECLGFEARKTDLLDRIKLANAEPPPPILNPAVANVHKAKITALAQSKSFAR